MPGHAAGGMLSQLANVAGCDTSHPRPPNAGNMLASMHSNAPILLEAHASRPLQNIVTTPSIVDAEIPRARRLVLTAALARAHGASLRSDTMLCPSTAASNADTNSATSANVSRMVSSCTVQSEAYSTPLACVAPSEANATPSAT